MALSWARKFALDTALSLAHKFALDTALSWARKLAKQAPRGAAFLQASEPRFVGK